MCKICHSDDRDAIEALAKQGFSPLKISEKMKEKGLNYSAETIKKHVAQHTNLTGLPKSYMTEKRQTPLETAIEISETIEIEAINKSLNIPDDLSKHDNLIDAIQKHSASIWLKTAAIVHAKLDRHALNPELNKFPSTEIRALDSLTNTLDTAWAYSISVSLPTAMKTLEAEGYTISESPEWALTDLKRSNGNGKST